MIHDLLLLPLHRGVFPALSIQWDEDAGALVGRDAERALEFVAGATSAGSVVIPPYPCAHHLSAEPLRSRPDMAAIFGEWYILPRFLEEVRPVGSSDDDDDGVDVTY